MERPKSPNLKELTQRLVLPLMPLLFLLTQLPIVSAQQEVTSGNPEKGIAITFDCGPWVYSDRVNSILDALKERDLKVTFFITGDFVERNPNNFERIIAEGHEIGNHSTTHPDFSTLSDLQIKDELAETERRANEFGVSTKPLWRAPFGARSSRVLVAAAEEGFDPNVMWSLDSSDWVDNISPAVVEGKLLSAGPGDIIVNHCNSWQTPQILPEVLDRFKEIGYEVVPVSKLLELPGP